MLQTIRRIAAAAALATPLVAQGVSVSPDGVGQALIYPYYTVREAPSSGSHHNTLVSVVNGTGEAKALRVRFREALTGASVFEATVFIGVRDVWTAAVVPVGDSAGLLTTDGTCTQPLLRSGVSGNVLTTATFSGDAYAQDPLGPSIDRVREGYIEVLELGSIDPNSDLHRQVSGIHGQPAPCKLGDAASIIAALKPPTGGLYGSATLINAMEGTAYGYDAVALSNWSERVTYSAAGSATPTLADANPPVSTFVNRGYLSIVSWSSGLDAVNGALLATNMLAEYMRDPVVAGATDIVYTMPTKPLAVSGVSVTNPFREKLTSSGACELVRASVYSRRQGVEPDPPHSHFSTFAGLCYAATVQSLAPASPTSSVVGSHAQLKYFQGPTQSPYVPYDIPAGFVSVDLLGLNSGPLLPKLEGLRVSAVNLMTGSVGESVFPTSGFFGLPVVGVSLTRYVNGSVVSGGTTRLSNYGTSSALRTSFPLPPAAGAGSLLGAAP